MIEGPIEGQLMSDERDLREFGAVITRLTRREDLTRAESRECWRQIIANEQPDLQQGAFMATLAMKGETSEEIAGSYEAILELDTNKVDLSHISPLVENCGTGMDTLKTFNISTAASVVAAACGISLAKHGARAITSKCGTVDVLERLGINVECDVGLAKRSVERAGIGIFNGMSANVHPRGLFRVLSKIRFGSTLNIAGSLANPARPTHAVRGVHSPHLVAKTAETMRSIGMKRALVCFGWNSDRSMGIDELSTMGESEICELKSDGTIESYSVTPEDFGIARTEFDEIAAADDPETAAHVVVNALSKGGLHARSDIVCLNAAAILYIAGKTENIDHGLEQARDAIASGRALDKLHDWIAAQNDRPEKGIGRFETLMANR